MADLHEFRPDWCLAPAACLREWLEEHHHMPPMLFAAIAWSHRPHHNPHPEVMRAARDEAARLIEEVLARAPLGEDHFALLAAGTRTPAGFWRRFEHNYRAGLAAGLKDATE